MTTKIILPRTKFFFAVEGPGEQSFIKWLQELSDRKGLHLNLDCEPLGGGGYATMFKRTMKYRQLRERRQAKSSILLVDSDRAARDDDGWTLQNYEKKHLNIRSKFVYKHLIRKVYYYACF